MRVPIVWGIVVFGHLIVGRLAEYEGRVTTPSQGMQRCGVNPGRQGLGKRKRR